jgi:predicted methyltransferase
MTAQSVRRFSVVLGVVFTIAIASLGFAQQDILNDPSRPEEERARDAGTKPLELYGLFDVESGSTVADLMPSSGYHTYILTKLVGNSGTVYSGPDRDDRMATRMAEQPLGNVTLIGGFGELPAGGVDVIITVRNFHDLVGSGSDADALAAWMTALKPGGTLGIVDARTTKDGYDSETHRINEQTVIDKVTAAGFEFVESSDLLSVSGDDYSAYAEGGDRSAIDRLTVIFRKPGH